MPKPNPQSPRLTRARKRLVEESQNTIVQQPEKITPITSQNGFKKQFATTKQKKPIKQTKPSKLVGLTKPSESPKPGKVSAKPQVTKPAPSKPVATTKRKVFTKPQANQDTVVPLKGQKRAAATKVSQPSNPKPTKASRSKKMPLPDNDLLDKALEEYAELAEANEKLTVEKCQDLRKEFKVTCDNTKRETQKLEQECQAKRRAGTTRSGTVRGATNRPIYSDGKWINKGIDDSQDKFDEAELEYLQKSVEKVKEVYELKLEHLKYLIIDIFLDELKSIQTGETDSIFHDEYHKLKGKARTELYSEVRTSLFTNEQKDYINGLLQGAFDTMSRDANGDIKHSDMNYVSLVMLAESTIRIVKRVHKFKTNEETMAFMKRSSRQALGCDEDDDDDDEY